MHHDIDDIIQILWPLLTCFHLFFLFFSCGHVTLQEALSVRLSVSLSIPQSVRPSVCEHEPKSRKTSVLETFCVCVCVGRGIGWGVGFGWGLAAPTQPSATILWPRVTCYFWLTGTKSCLKSGQYVNLTLSRACKTTTITILVTLTTTKMTKRATTKTTTTHGVIMSWKKHDYTFFSCRNATQEALSVRRSIALIH